MAVVFTAFCSLPVKPDGTVSECVRYAEIHEADKRSFKSSDCGQPSLILSTFEIIDPVVGEVRAA